jgi:hypothetical protein
MKRKLRLTESQLNTIIKLVVNERFDWKGDWIPDDKDPFDKARDYASKQDLINELTEILTKYEIILKGGEIVSALKHVMHKYEKNLF